MQRLHDIFSFNFFSFSFSSLPLSLSTPISPSLILGQRRRHQRSIPENVHECIRLTEEFHVLPKDHIAKEDKLEKSAGVILREEDVAVSNVKIDLTRGKDNSLESIKFFKSSLLQEVMDV